MCNQRYEDRGKLIWKELCTRDEGDDNKHKVVSYFCKKSHGQKYDVTGQEVKFDVDYSKLVNRKWAVSRLKEIMFTKKGRLKQKFVDLQQHESYDTASLMLYLNQCIAEGSDNCLLSYKEYKFLVEGK